MFYQQNVNFKHYQQTVKAHSKKVLMVKRLIKCQF